MRQVFGLDFTRWKEKGLWDPAYTPFAAFVDGRCVATLCVYPSRMRVEGRECRAAQLLTVGTLPEFRGRGLQRRLWALVSERVRGTCDFSFLFTHAAAAGFYERLGFERRRELAGRIALSATEARPTRGLRKLDLDAEADYRLIERLAAEREMVSDRLGCANPNLLLFRFLYSYRDFSYYAASLDAVVVVERVERRLRLHDIVARRMPTWEKLAPLLGAFGRRTVDVLFCADRLGVARASQFEITDDLLFVDDRFDLAPPFVFPGSTRV